VKLSRLAAAETLRMLGVPGVIGITLLVFSLSYAASALWPAKLELDAKREQAASQRERVAQARAGFVDQSPAGQLRAFYSFLPPQPAAPQWLDRIYAAAEKERIALLRGEYGLVIEPETGVARYRILFPVKGSYSQIRGFIAGALDAVPALALDDVNFERQKISDGQLDAKIRMTLYLKKA
jgi:hypothetical protein